MRDEADWRRGVGLEGEVERGVMNCAKGRVDKGCLAMRTSESDEVERTDQMLLSLSFLQAPTHSFQANLE